MGSQGAIGVAVEDDLLETVRGIGGGGRAFTSLAVGFKRSDEQHATLQGRIQWDLCRQDKFQRSRLLGFTNAIISQC